MSRGSLDSSGRAGYSGRPDYSARLDRTTGTTRADGPVFPVGLSGKRACIHGRDVYNR